MGYARGAYALGYVDDLRDPIAVVRPDLARRGFQAEASADRLSGRGRRVQTPRGLACRRR